MNTIDNTQDIIDVRDVIERVETLEDECDPTSVLATNITRAELKRLRTLLEDLKGRGGDEQWCGDWYPVTLIRRSYWVKYVQELLEDCGEIPRNLPHYIAIDWDATASNIKVDYSSVDVGGVEYLYR